ncbi:MAG TPA: hypothetical protein VNL91_02050 [Thermoanaerobaculia bacterium]|nr:hypothetical protein [Thermoanaerobaculia bacterium]
MNVDYYTLENDVASGIFRHRLEEELTSGFRDILHSGERLPPASHYASRIAQIVSAGSTTPFPPEFAFHLYQEILAACEHARAAVLGEEPS